MTNPKHKTHNTQHANSKQKNKQGQHQQSKLRAQHVSRFAWQDAGCHASSRFCLAFGTLCLGAWLCVLPGFVLTRTICCDLHVKPRFHMLSVWKQNQNPTRKIKTQTFKTNSNIKTQTATSTHNKQNQHQQHTVGDKKQHLITIIKTNTHRTHNQHQNTLSWGQKAN